MAQDSATRTIVRPLTESLARLRHARVFHPEGLIAAAEVEMTGHPRWPEGIPLAAGRHEGVVRMSKAVPTPGALPDVLGLALHLPEGPLDLLFATTGALPLARHSLRPRARFDSGLYGTLLPYAVGGGTYVLAARPAGRLGRIPASPGHLAEALSAGPVAFDLLAARLLGGWRRWARLTLRDAPTSVIAPEAFDPVVNALPGFHPVGFLRDLRGAAYAGSREGRGAEKTGGRSRVTSGGRDRG